MLGDLVNPIFTHTSTVNSLPEIRYGNLPDGDGQVLLVARQVIISVSRFFDLGNGNVLEQCVIQNTKVFGVSYIIPNSGIIHMPPNITQTQAAPITQVLSWAAYEAIKATL